MDFLKIESDKVFQFGKPLMPIRPGLGFAMIVFYLPASALINPP
jgi:hypothetical protein